MGIYNISSWWEGDYSDWFYFQPDYDPEDIEWLDEEYGRVGDIDDRYLNYEEGLKYPELAS